MILLAPMFLAAVSSTVTTATSAPEQGDRIIFSYNPTTIHQEVSVDLTGKTSLTARVRAARTESGPDTVLVGVELYGQGGGGIYFHDTGWVPVSDSGYGDISLTVDESAVGTAWNEVRSVRITIGGDDAEFWAGNYGPSIESASLKLDGTELLLNGEFAFGTQFWGSPIGWQQCAATQGDRPCSTLESRTNNTPYILSSDMVWASANEGWDLSLTAPGGGVFSQVVFASYGNPSGEDGAYTQDWCHATNSIQKVSEAFVGKTSATIGASNGIFGDPCGGTYKKLNVVLRYTGGTPNVPTTTTTTPPVCGPYENITVTGALNGTVWGSGPYTDDSDMGVAAVHAGLIAVGETATLALTDPMYYTSYPGSTANGVTTTDWLFGWCGHNLTRYTPPTTTTATTTTTTTTLPPPTTTTTTTEPPVATTTTTSTVPVQTTVLQQAEQPKATTSTSTVPVTTTTTSTTTTTLPPEQKAPVPAASAIAEIKTPEALTRLVETVDLEEIKPDQAIALVTNAAFTALATDKLEAVFESIPVSELSIGQEAALVEALTGAPAEVKETFETAVDIYAEGLDEYVPVGSTVDVATRRSVIAVTTVMATVTAAGAAPGAGGGQPGGGGSGGNSPRTGDDANKAVRREEEEEEEAGGLEGPEDREKNLNTRNSIYNYKEDGTKEFNIMGFIKKFLKETAALSFTFAGSAIMFVTLSGDTRRIAIIATAAAVFVHYVHVMLENDED